MGGNYSMHTCILALYLLQQWIYFDLMRSYRGVGTFTLCSEYQLSVDSPDQLDQSSPCPPSQIVALLDDKRALAKQGNLPEEIVYSEVKTALKNIACELAKSGAVKMNPQEQSFSVQCARTNTQYQVKLFPKPSCTCDVGSSLCTHTLAAK